VSRRERKATHSPTINERNSSRNLSKKKEKSESDLDFAHCSIYKKFLRGLKALLGILGILEGDSVFEGI
jgi:hypothetical protein